MASSDSELKQEVRDYTGVSETNVSERALESNIRRAKHRIVNRKSTLDAPTEVEWYDPDEAYEEALFWHSCLFVKITAGELDAPGGSIGNIRTNSLSADNTEIYRNAQESLRMIDVGGLHGTTTVERENRSYVGGEDDRLPDTPI